MAYRQTKPCGNCPFNKKGPGLRLRRSLMPGRYKEILAGLRKGDHFICHKTVSGDEEEWHGEETCVAEMMAEGAMLCAGAIKWQAERGIKSQALEICERLFGERL